MNFLAARCPACNGELQVPDDRDFVKCMYCGVDVKVRETINLKLDINIPNILTLLNLANTSLKSKNYQEAYNYYNKILESDVSNYDAWFGKAKASGGLLSNLKGLGNRDMLICFENAVKYFNGNNLSDFNKQIAFQIYNICDEYLRKVLLYRDNNIQNNSRVWEEFINHCKFIIELLEEGLIYDVQNLKIIKELIFICTNNINIDGIYSSGIELSNDLDESSKLWLNSAYKNSLQDKINYYSSMLSNGKAKVEKPQETHSNIKTKTGKSFKKSHIIIPILSIIIIVLLLVLLFKITIYF